MKFSSVLLTLCLLFTFGGFLAASCPCNDGCACGDDCLCFLSSDPDEQPPVDRDAVKKALDDQRKVEVVPVPAVAPKKVAEPIKVEVPKTYPPRVTAIALPPTAQGGQSVMVCGPRGCRIVQMTTPAPAKGPQQASGVTYSSRRESSGHSLIWHVFHPFGGRFSRR